MVDHVAEIRKNKCLQNAGGSDYMEHRHVVMVKSSGVLRCAGKIVPAFRELVLCPYLGSSNSGLFLDCLTLKVKTLPFLN
jgi:hypothetical protein